MAAIHTHSTLESMARCPSQGVDSMGPRVEKAGPARQGNWWHAVALRYVKRLTDKQWPSDVEYGRELVKRMRGMLSPDDEKGVAEHALRWMELYDGSWLMGWKGYSFEERRYCTVNDRIHIEAEKLVDIPGPVFSWQSDLTGVDANGILNVVDYKSGWNIQHTSAPDKNRQLVRYAAPWIDDGVTGVRLHIDHVRHNYRESHSMESLDVLARWEELVVHPVASAERYLAGGREIPMVIGSHCSNCDRRGACPAYVRYPQEFDVADADAPGLVSAVAIFKAKAKDAEVRLRQVVDKQGSLEHGGFEAGYRIDEQIDFDSLKAQEILEEYLPPELIRRHFKATKTSLMKLFKEAQLKKDLRDSLFDRIRSEAGTVKKKPVFIVKRASTREEEDAEEEG